MSLSELRSTIFFKTANMVASFMLWAEYHKIPAVSCAVKLEQIRLPAIRHFMS